VYATKSVSPLTIADPKSFLLLSAATGVIKAGIDVYNGQMSAAQNQLQSATSALTSSYSDQIDYYKSINSYYESVASDNQAELTTLTKDEQDFLQSKITTLEADKKRIQDTSDAIKNAMIDPDTALAYASAGVTLNDSPEVISQKLAKYGYSKELSDNSKDMAEKGYTALVSGNPPAGSEVVRITDSQGKVKTYWKKSSGGVGGATDDITTYAQAYLDGQIELTNIPQEIRASVISKANQIASDALKTKEATVTPKAPVTAYSAGQSINTGIKPFYEAMKPENLWQGTKTVGSTVGNFFSGLFGL